MPVLFRNATRTQKKGRVYCRICLRYIRFYNSVLLPLSVLTFCVLKKRKTSSQSKLLLFAVCTEAVKLMWLLFGVCKQPNVCTSFSKTVSRTAHLTSYNNFPTCISHFFLSVRPNRVLRRICGPKRDEVAGEWRKLRSEELNDLYSSPNKIDKNEMGGACRAYGGEERYIQGSGGGNLRERDNLEEPGVDGRKILRWSFRKWDVGVWIGSSWLRIGTGGGDL